MKINNLSHNDSSLLQPCEVVQDYLRADRDCVSFRQWIAKFDYDSKDDIVKAIKNFCVAVTADKYMSQKQLQTTDPNSVIVYKRFYKLATDISRYDKYAATTAAEIWEGGYLQRQIKNKFAALLQQKPTRTFAQVCRDIKSIYGLNDNDITKLRFFVEQVKAQGNFPPSLRRMLYLWGETKKTGKTTFGRTLVSVLNGQNDISNVHACSSRLVDEMQIKSFAVPKISKYQAVLLDEAFYSDMSKTYADFKRFLTSENGTARLPYGQEFEWCGYPNYVATSNDSLRKFIKDWDDRRFLSVEFKTKPSELSFDDIFQLVKDFVITSSPVDDFATWSDAIFDEAEEQGERSVISEEFIVELQQQEFREYLNQRRAGGANDKITLKVFVDYFARSIGNVEAHKRKGEIERAVLHVFGERYSTTNYWRLSKLQEIANFSFNGEDNEDNEDNEEETKLLF